MMHLIAVWNRFNFNCLAILVAALLVTQPIFAERPPDGYARPPIHVRGNSTKAPTGLSPAQVRKAYGFDQLPNQGDGQTVAIVDAYDDPNIFSDLNSFKSKFGIPATACNLSEIFAQGSRPRTDPGWSLEISLDVEWACAVAPNAHIILVEAATNSFANLFGAVDAAAQTGAATISMSWGGSEFSSEFSSDGHFVPHNVVFTASSGDSGTGVEYPAASPYVLGVGGTTLKLNTDGSYSSETAWSGSGGGISTYESKPTWQTPNNVSNRGVPDVAYDADPATGFSVYDSVRYQGQSGWFQVGGTSAGAPQWAAFVAIVNSGRATIGKLALSGPGPIYSAWAAVLPTDFYDITSGSNGACGTVCNAAAGYDYVTGLGSPIVVNLYNHLVAQ